jgi:hypothetical protein
VINIAGDAVVLTIEVMNVKDMIPIADMKKEILMQNRDHRETAAEIIREKVAEKIRNDNVMMTILVHRISRVMENFKNVEVDAEEEVKKINASHEKNLLT